MTLKKNDIVNLTITSATAEGSGVGRTDDGIAVFVQGSAIGDELNVQPQHFIKFSQSGVILALDGTRISSILPKA